MNDAFGTQNFGSLAEVIAHIALRANPIKIAVNSLGETDLRGVPRRPDCIRPAGKVSHFPRTKFPINFRRDSYSERVGNALRNFADGHPFSAADVYWPAIESIGCGGEQIRARDILNERKIAGLLSVFIKNWRQIVKQTGAKNRDHTGVRIEDRLSGSVSARVPQRNGWNPDLFSPEQDQFLLIDFG